MVRIMRWRPSSRWHPGAAIVVAVAAATTPGAIAGHRTMVWLSSDRMAPEPNYDTVLATEFQAAVKQGTREALIRFISRHPGQALAKRALHLLKEGSGLPLSRPGAADPDADVYAAFDHAFRADTPAAYDTFVGRYAPHPLTEQAKQLRNNQ